MAKEEKNESGIKSSLRGISLEWNLELGDNWMVQLTHTHVKNICGCCKVG